MPAETVDIVSNKEVTINFHHWCLTPQNFSAFHMENFWKMLATGKDINQLGKYSVDHQFCQRGSPKGAKYKGALSSQPDWMLFFSHIYLLGR